MSTGSITHRPTRTVTAAAAAAAVAAVALAYTGLALRQDDASPAPGHHSTTVDNFRKHAGRLHTTTPAGGGRTVVGLP
jgi:hypothetical protein